jgi:signal transduction histidine kinase
VAVFGAIAEALFVVLPDPGPVFVRADPARLRQIAWNLLSNVIKFTDNAGSIELRLKRDDGQAVISVSDTGCGVAPEFLRHVLAHGNEVNLWSIARAPRGARMK